MYLSWLLLALSCPSTHSTIVRRRILNYGLLSRKLQLFFGLVLTMLFTSGAQAAPQNYLQHPIFLNMLDELEKEEQFNRQDLINLFQEVYRQDAILEAMSRPAEKTKTWGEYKPIFVNEQGIEKGVKFWSEHEETLRRAAMEFNVPEAMIVAIIGVETYYGRIQGSYPVIDAISTLAFHYPKRGKFFARVLR